MPYHLFQFSIPGPGDLQELNRFLESQRVVSVQQHLVPCPSGAVLTFVVQTTASPAAPAREKSERKVDYKEALSPEQFTLFSHLRELRKEWAQSEGVPVYTLFSNEHLAEMVRRPILTRADLARIPGVGQARLDKYGDPLIAALRTASATPGTSSEPST